MGPAKGSQDETFLRYPTVRTGSVIRDEGLPHESLHDCIARSSWFVTRRSKPPRSPPRRKRGYRVTLTSGTGVLPVKQTSLLRLAAVVSSALLAAGFVAYRAGTFNRPIETDARPDDPRTNQPDSGSGRFTTEEL